MNHRRKRRAKKIGADGRAAKRIAAEITVKLARGDFALPERGLSFEALAEELMEKYPAAHAVASNTHDNYIGFVRNHLIPYFGTMPVTSIGYDVVEDLVAEKRSPKGSVRYPGRAISDTSLRVGLVPLRLIFDRAIHVHKLLTVNPALGHAPASVGSSSRT